MLRGNHECRQLTSFFNFKHECENKYDDEVYERVMESFDALPLACVINEKFVAVHGGISPSIESVKK
jgi:serine/threonine-protein phosphatase 2B catalytic subunit